MQERPITAKEMFWQNNQNFDSLHQNQEEEEQQNKYTFILLDCGTKHGKARSLDNKLFLSVKYLKYF